MTGNRDEAMARIIVGFWIAVAFWFGLMPFAVADDVTPRQASPYWYLKAGRIRAYHDRDRRYFERLLAPEFVSVSTSGRRLSREEYLQSEFGDGASARPKVDTRVEDFRTIRRQSTLIMTYGETETSIVGNNIFEVHLSRLDVYVKSGKRWLLQAMTAIRLPEAPKRILVDVSRLANYVGRYEFAPDSISSVRLDGETLLEQTTGNPEGELVPIGPDTFYEPPDIEAVVTFERDAAGRVVAQVYRSGSQALRAPRMEH